MPKCIKCKGKGQATLNVYSEEASPKSFEIDCVHCDGSGRMTNIEIKQTQWFDLQWCKCDFTPNETRYYADGQHPDCDKHHYRCGTCGLITQIG